jgi:hypothetical protein
MCGLLFASLLGACSSSDSQGSTSSGGASNATGGAIGGGSGEATGGTSTGGVVSAGGGGTGTGGSTGGATGGSTGGASLTPEPTDLPVIDSVAAFIGEDGAIGVKFEGRTGASPAEMVYVDFLDAAGVQLGLAAGWGEWFARPDRFFSQSSAGKVEQLGERVAGYISALDDSLEGRPELVRVTLRDREQKESQPLEAEIQEPSPEPRENGAVCDPFEVLDRCGDGALCDVVNGAGRVAPTCQVPEPTCPLDLPLLEGSVEADNSDSPDSTDSSCTFTRGRLGNDQGHTFVATRSGTHRFRAEETDYQAALSLSVRKICNFGRPGDSELGCTHQRDAGEGLPLELDVELEAGQTVFVFVESSWVNGGKYALSVEEPD